MRRAAHVDANHVEIVKALRRVGATAKSLAPMGKGIPDLLVGFRNMNFLLEVKNLEAVNKAKEPRLTDDEQDFHASWAGQVAVVTTPDEAVRVVVEAARPAR